MTAAALRFAPPLRCHRDLGPGEVKRISSRGHFLGYYLKCPACRAMNQCGALEFVETLPLVEQPPEPGKVSASALRPTALATRAPIPCRECKRGIVVRDERVELAP